MRKVIREKNSLSILEIYVPTTKSYFPKLRFPEFSDEWVQTTLGKCSEALEYGMNSAAITFDGENKYIRITDIDEASSKYTPNIPVSPEGDLEDKYLVKENDILLARTGASTGKSYLYNIKDGKLYFAGFLIKVKVKHSNNASFIFNQTKTSQYQKWVKIMSMRSGQPGINSKEYASFKFWVPSKLEQDRIANFLSLVDERIATQNKIIEDYKLLKKGLMQKIFKQEIRFKDENGNYYPKWEVRKLGEVADITMGQSPDSKSYNDNKTGFPLIQGNADIQNRVSSPRQWTNQPTKVCDISDLILTVRAPVGSISKSIHNACIGRGVCAIKNKSIINIDFLYQLLLWYEPKWVRVEQGSTFTAVSGKDIKNLKFLIPNLQEQQKIAATLSAIDKKIALEEGHLDKLKAQKKYLLQNLFV
ncbi:MAG: restriction endonuclease subunit S [Xanthomarina gelatinilytica]|uniref:restriction endonuclease subunit S n=1 Tax=Xanthomarina gelatinilytica TaxID=1137281 RepID=UPI003A866983